MAVSNPSEWGTVRAPRKDRLEGKTIACFKPLGVGDGARTPALAGRTHRTGVVSNPSEWGTVRAPIRRLWCWPATARFQTPRSGGRCAHQVATGSRKLARKCFKPLGVGDGARTGQEVSGWVNIQEVSNPSEWGTVRAPAIKQTVGLGLDQFQTPRSGGRCAHRGKCITRFNITSAFQTPRSGGRCAHRELAKRVMGASLVSNPSEWGTVRAPFAVMASHEKEEAFQTPRSGGRCAHQSAS